MFYSCKQHFLSTGDLVSLLHAYDFRPKLIGLHESDTQDKKKREEKTITWTERDGAKDGKLNVCF